MKSILSLAAAIAVAVVVGGCSNGDQTETAARPLSPEAAAQAAKPAVPVPTAAASAPKATVPAPAAK